MVRLTADLSLSPDNVTLYHASDPLLGNLPVLIFHGPSTTANYTLNSSRLQIHVLSPAGFQSYPRITISPSSPFHSVVHHLPRELQGDDVHRGLAFGLCRYFCELPDCVKSHLRNLYPARSARRPGSGPALFSHQHAAALAQAMTKAASTSSVISSIREALQTQHISNLDIDFVLPPGAIVPLPTPGLEPDLSISSEAGHSADDDDLLLDPSLRQYGGYTPIIKMLGEPVFLPTANLRRAPSKPTSLNRAKTFSRDQKYDLRMKLAELVDTEERYVLKLDELVRQIARQFREAAQKRPPDSLSPSSVDLDRLFPPSADRILQLNSAFVDQLRRVMDETEEAALNDMQSTASTSNRSPRDPIGVLAMSRLFLEWFPAFTECYQDYIKASQHFPSLLNQFLEHQSSFRQRVHQTGEQAIRSILIEPVQRLPRYSLFIDQITAMLPMTHPALQPMLRARDIITNICSMDDPVPGKSHVANRLRHLVEAWPLSLEPQGRLILAADFIELQPPFHPPSSRAVAAPDSAGLFILFSDHLVVLRKTGDTMTGRDLLREVEKPSAAELLVSLTNAATGPRSYSFTFTDSFSLADIRFTESSDGSLVWMSSTQQYPTSAAAVAEAKTASRSATARCFLLREAFEGKAARWSEEIVKARIEARFPESERENPAWALRSIRMPDTGLGFHFAIYQEAAHQLVDGRREPAPIRVVVDHEKGTKGAPVGHYGVEAVVSLSTGNGFDHLSMLTVGLGGKQFQDDVAVEDLLSTMSRRIIQLLSTQFDVANPQFTPALVSYYTRTLRSLDLSGRADRTRSFLSTSPVKLISSLWSGGSSSNPSPDVLLSGREARQQTSLHRSDSQHSVLGPIRGGGGEGFAALEGQPENPLVRLEETFNGYIAALRARKGAIIGRTLLNRSLADELSVNDLYNRLIESPLDYEMASKFGTEVVFVAFEKFVHIAWAERIGPVMTMQALDTLQERANKRVPGDFADFVGYLFRDMTPQNRRAFPALIKLLADLLDGCGNDSDRGVLTLAFAELLVTDGSAPAYINLLDRLVEDCERIFEDPVSSQGISTPPIGSLNSAIRHAKTQQGSLTSNTSLRRKFGLDLLLRQGSRDERPSVWRSLSRHRHPAPGESSSLSRVTLGRARSIDDNSLAKRLHSRALSRERPAILGAFPETAPERPVSLYRPDIPLETIGEPASSEQKAAKKKRRSSLSDLKNLMAAASLEEEPRQPLQTTKQTSGKINASAVTNVSPKATTPSRIPMSPNSSGTMALRNSRQKENVAEVFVGGTLDSTPLQANHDLFSKLDSPTKRAGSPTKALETVTIRRGHTKAPSTSSIPTFRSPRPPTSGSDSPTRSGAQRLRLQSPQKLRERLQTEKKAADDADASLQSELSKIGEEMARVNSGRAGRGIESTDLRQLAASMKALEEKVSRMMGDLMDKQTATQREVNMTLKSSEAKARAVDQLHKEVVAENELLYEKFNGELGKIVKALKGKGKEDKEELVSRLKEQGEETARLKRENARLKRELASLRAGSMPTE